MIAAPFAAPELAELDAAEDASAALLDGGAEDAATETITETTADTTETTVETTTETTEGSAAEGGQSLGSVARGSQHVGATVRRWLETASGPSMTSARAITERPPSMPDSCSFRTSDRRER